MKKATSQDVAKLAGVSQSTVSMILNKKDNVSFSQETIESVLAAAKKLHYQPASSRGKAMQNGNKTIAVFCPTIRNPYYTMLLQKIGDQASKHGYSILICNTQRKSSEEERYVNMFLNGFVCGVIYTYFPQFPELFQKISYKLPTVVMGDKDETINADAVELNSIKAGTIIADYLLSLGHEKIAYISTPIQGRQLARHRRLEGIRKEYEKHGFKDGVIVRMPEAASAEEVTSSNTEYAAGYNLTKELFQEGEQGITAFVGLNDMVALGIMDALLDMKFKIPQDYSVVGCDNTILSTLRRISLTTVEHFITKKGEDAFHLLLNKLENHGLPQKEITPIMRLEYEPKLIIRDTTGPNRNKKKKINDNK
jgi:LacI family transcriptional regulator